VKAQAANRAHKKWVKPGAAILAIATALITSAVAPNYLILWGFMGWGFYYVAIRAIGIPETTTFQAALSTAEARYRSTLTQFNDFRHSSQGSHHAFTNKRRKLDTLHRRWNELPAKRASGLQKLEAERQKQQLEKFLGNFFIDHANA
jgi:hypothetical protein